MNARLQQLLLLLRLAIGLGVLSGFWRVGMAWQGAVGFLLVFWAWAWLLLLRFLLPHLHAPARWPQALIAWWSEAWACERVFSWQQPFAANAEPDHLPAESGGKRGVLLLHGFSCNRGLWNPWMRALRQRGQPFVALTLEPAYGSIDAYADMIEAAIRRLEQCSPGVPPLIVAHSMGGLAARAWWRQHGRIGRVRRLITLGSPHAGTLLAHLSHTTNGRQMRRDSAWLSALAASEPARLYQQFDCLYSALDQVVFPVETAVLPGAQPLQVPRTGHLGLVFVPQSYAAMQRYLDEAP